MVLALCRIQSDTSILKNEINIPENEGDVAEDETWGSGFDIGSSKSLSSFLSYVVLASPCPMHTLKRNVALSRV